MQYICAYRWSHLVLTAIAIGAAGAGTSAVLVPFLAPVALGLVGFGAAGPVAGEFPPEWCGIIRSAHTNKLELVGSIAAGVQAGIGNVVAGSLFAGAQSVAMGGALPGAITAVSSAVSGVTGAGLAALLI